MNPVAKYITISILLIVIVGSYLYAAVLWRHNAGTISINLARVTREIAMPYRIARISRRPIDRTLPVPVYGIESSDIRDTWGAARADGRVHEGVDIFAERGTPVFSATDGYVMRTNIGSRGGRNVMVIGPGGLMYYYAHLERVAEGVERGTPVTPDDVLGFVGNSGNATQTPPHLHLGIYRERWEAQNPYPFLENRWRE